MTTSANISSFVIVALIIIIGISAISDIISQSSIEENSAPLHTTFESIATIFNGGFGLLAIAVFVLGFAVLMRALDYI